MITAFLAMSAFAGWADSFHDSRPEWLRDQSWMRQSDGDLRRDLAFAAVQGKALMVLWEQSGCVYCARLHDRNFQRREIAQLLDDGFVTVQLDIKGTRRVIGLDGVEMSEAELARRWRVNTTPTTVVLSSEDPDGSRLDSVEVFRMPGYLRPFRYYAMLHFFVSGAYRTEEINAHFAARAEELSTWGIDPETW